MSNLMKIHSINIISSSMYNLPKNEDCTICKCNLNAPSLYNQDKGIESVVAIGVCGHSFHYECIMPWINMHKYCGFPGCCVLWLSKPV